MSNYRFGIAVGNRNVDTLTTRIYEALREEILTGALKPGCRLVRRVVSKRLGVSHIPVTEALLRLEVDGLVENRPLYGCRVRPLTLEEVKNDELMREAIECLAVRLCAQNASEGTISQLMTAAKRLDRIGKDGDPLSKLGMQLHQAFHYEVARQSGCEKLAEELRRVWVRRMMVLNWVKNAHYGPVTVYWHEHLIAAIAMRDPDRAERAMREHVQIGCDYICKALADLNETRKANPETNMGALADEDRRHMIDLPGQSGKLAQLA